MTLHSSFFTWLKIIETLVYLNLNSLWRIREDKLFHSLSLTFLHLTLPMSHNCTMNTILSTLVNLSFTDNFICTSFQSAFMCVNLVKQRKSVRLTDNVFWIQHQLWFLCNIFVLRHIYLKSWILDKKYLDSSFVF